MKVLGWLGRWLLATYAAVGLLLALALHVSMYVQPSLVLAEAVYLPLFLGIFPLVVCVIITQARRQGSAKRINIDPPRGMVVIGIAMANAGIHFLLFLLSYWNAKPPVVEHGHYFMQVGQQTIELTVAQYLRYQVFFTRTITSVVMVFYLAGLLTLAYPAIRKSPAEDYRIPDGPVWKRYRTKAYMEVLTAVLLVIWAGIGSVTFRFYFDALRTHEWVGVAFMTVWLGMWYGLLIRSAVRLWTSPRFIEVDHQRMVTFISRSGRYTLPATAITAWLAGRQGIRLETTERSIYLSPNLEGLDDLLATLREAHPALRVETHVMPRWFR